MVVEDDETNLAVAEHRQLIRLLHQPKLAFEKRHLPVLRVNKSAYLTVALVRDGLNANLAATHV
jgi:hypothetical protein